MSITLLVYYCYIWFSIRIRILKDISKDGLQLVAYSRESTLNLVREKHLTVYSISYILKTLKSKKFLNWYFIFPIFQSSLLRKSASTVTEVRYQLTAMALIPSSTLLSI